MDELVVCPVCGLGCSDADELAVHLVDQAEASDGRHVMWLNRNVTKHRLPASELAPLLRAALDGERPGTTEQVRR